MECVPHPEGTRKTIAAVLFIATSTTGARQIGTAAGGPLTLAGVPIYAIGDNGHLFWLFHQGSRTGLPTWANRGERVKRVGRDGGDLLRGITHQSHLRHRSAAP